jgi:ABC-2 type transport system ATP-binding protein
MKRALELRGVEVRFKRFTLGPLDLELEPGKVFGLVGPNGSGKTTTIRCIAGNLQRDGGAVSVCDRAADPRDGSWKEEIGYVPDVPVFYEWMTGRRFLQFISGFYPSWSESFAAELSHRFSLDLDEKAKSLSKGSRVKLSLVAALAHRPHLALFDEPTAGLDPVVRTEVFDVLWEMMEANGMTILYSTHILDDLHRLADELVFLMRGQIRLRAGKDDLIDRWRRIRFQHPDELADLDGAVLHESHGEMHELVTPNGKEIEAELTERGATSIRAQPLTLEEIAVHIMKGN